MSALIPVTFSINLLAYIAKTITFVANTQKTMAHHQHEEEKSYDYLYYVVGLVCGLFTGGIIEKGAIWILIGGVLGLLTAGFFLKVLVKGREQA